MMPRRRLLISLVEITDLAVIFAALLATLAITTDALDARSARDLLHTPITLQNLLPPAAYLIAWHIVLTAGGLYDSYRLAPARREPCDLLLAVSLIVLPLYFLGFLRPGPRVDLVFVLTLGMLTYLGLAAERRILRAAGGIVRRLGRNLRVIAIVGEGATARATAAKLAEHTELGYRVAAILDVEATGGEVEAKAVLARLDAVLDDQAVDEVLFALPLDRSQPLLAQLIAPCEEQGITIRLLANVALPRRAWTAVDTLGEHPVVTIASGPSNALSLGAKRLIDLAGALAGIVIFSPLMLLVALAVRIDSPGPVVFRQQRVGLNRRRFWAYKFRTMVTGAERLQAQLEGRNEAEGPVFKIRDDPRITRAGGWLRRTSLDELPQLFNVLKGEMSLVGPRPLPVRDVDRIDVRWHKRRFSVKPGITCLWQVKSREPKFDEWIRADMEYIDNWSLALDFKILALTVPAVFSRQGAH
jgi:exopolysaccharide biosynthesis polyprenyl glycosylphosphotransferase